MRLLFLLVLMLHSCSISGAQNIAAFYSGYGPTLVALDTASGNFSCNAYTENGFGVMQSFTPTYPPKNGTSMASAGFYSTTAVYGAVFYQTLNNTLVQHIFKCRYSSGDCSSYGGYLISTNVTVPVRAGTGISASLISTDLGYRVTYEDIHGSVRQLSYSNNTQGVVTYWNDGVLTSNTTAPNGSALSTSYVKSFDNSGVATIGQQTVFQVAGDRILSFSESNVTAINQFHTWVVNTPITDLPNWDPVAVNYATVNYNQWLMLFYVDTTRRVQWVWSTDGGINWLVQPTQDTSIWPLADIPNAPIAAATSINASDYSSSLFYVSNGTYIQSVLKDWSFTPYSVVGPRAQSNTTVKIAAPLQSQSSHRVITIGVSTGVSVGFLFCVAVLACYLSRKKRAISSIETGESIGEWKGSELSFYGKPELDGQSRNIFELDHDPECLLSHQLQLFRTYELKGTIPVELENSEALRPELDHTLCKCKLDALVVYELPVCSEKSEEYNTENPKNKDVAVSVKELSA